MGKPSAAIGATADRVLRRRQRQNSVRNGPLLLQVSPCGIAGPDRRAPGPTFGRAGARFVPALARPRRIGWDHADEATQRRAGLAESESRLEGPNQVEHVALCVARWVPPAAAVVVDDDDLASAAAILQRLARALALVQSPLTELLERGGTAHPAPEQIEFRVVQHACSPGSCGPGLSPCPALFSSAPPGAQPRSGIGARASRRSRAVPGRPLAAIPAQAAQNRSPDSGPRVSRGQDAFYVRTQTAETAGFMLR